MIHLVSLSAVTWDFPLIGRTRMLTEAWQRLGMPTTFVQVPYLRTALQRILPGRRELEPVPVIRPWPTYPRRVWPLIGPDRLHASIARRARALRRQLEAMVHLDGAVAVVVSPVWTPWLDELRFGRVVYDCIDEVSVHVPRAELAPLYERWESELVNRATGAVATAQRLEQTLRARREDLPTAVIRNGVDAERFTRLAGSTPRPTDLPDGRRPIVGFVGAMYAWLDWELMAHSIAGLREFDFVFVGPHHGRGDVDRISSLPNVRLLGRRPYEQVPAYVQAFDVCWVPFDSSAVATAANPVKIYEYLALGKPVVSTPVADMATFGDLVTVARTAEETIECLRAAAGSSALVEQRIAFARANSWEARARDFAEFAAALPKTP